MVVSTNASFRSTKWRRQQTALSGLSSMSDVTVRGPGA